MKNPMYDAPTRATQFSIDELIGNGLEQCQKIDKLNTERDAYLSEIDALGKECAVSLEKELNEMVENVKKVYDTFYFKRESPVQLPDVIFATNTIPVSELTESPFNTLCSEIVCTQKKAQSLLTGKEEPVNDFSIRLNISAPDNSLYRENVAVFEDGNLTIKQPEKLVTVSDRDLFDRFYNSLEKSLEKSIATSIEKATEVRDNVKLSYDTAKEFVSGKAQEQENLLDDFALE